MKRGTLTIVTWLTLGFLMLSVSSLRADEEHLLNVLVSFGAGLNTEGQGNHLNHLIIPPEIRVKEGGVVHFSMGGFHQVFVYKPGTRPQDISVPDTSPLPQFIDDLQNLYYQGIRPVPPGTLTSANPSNTTNRMESVYFAERGTYLVLCNVTAHFLDGMYAFVKVVP